MIERKEKARCQQQSTKRKRKPKELNTKAPNEVVRNEQRNEVRGGKEFYYKSQMNYFMQPR
jgi:hypothetical protein